MKNIKANAKRIFNKARRELLNKEFFPNGDVILVDVLDDNNKLTPISCTVYKFDDELYIDSEDLLLRVTKNPKYGETKLEAINLNRLDNYEAEIENIDVAELVLDKDYSELNFKQNVLPRENPNFETLHNRFRYTIGGLKLSEDNKVTKNQLNNLAKSKNDEDFYSMIEWLITPIVANKQQ